MCILKKNFFIYCLLFILILTSCTTSPILPPVSEDDTLLIIVVEYDRILLKGPKVRPFSYLELEFKDYPETITIKPRNGEIFIHGLPSGDYITTQYTEKEIKKDDNWIIKGLPNTEEFEVSFVLKPGYINIFPTKFVYRQTSIVGGGSIIMGFATDIWETETLKEDEIKTLLQELKDTYENFILWKSDLIEE